ncbi:MAG: hypothetical protein A4S08_00055 [Proteobacteria bacterium SG_bin4]|nr:MAG: hypothetical protein A4S08_00055 [Proteobacteria bacterium SG_bin4]
MRTALRAILVTANILLTSTIFGRSGNGCVSRYFSMDRLFPKRPAIRRIELFHHCAKCEDSNHCEVFSLDKYFQILTQAINIKLYQLSG